MKRKNFTKGKKDTFQKSDFFKYRESGQIQLWLGNTFKTLLVTASENLSIVNIPKYKTLDKQTYDDDILARYGEEVMVQPIDTVLAEIQAIVTSKNKIFADGCATFWYICHNNCIFYVGCNWDSYFQEWSCYAHEADEGSNWNAGHRMALPASL